MYSPTFVQGMAGLLVLVAAGTALFARPTAVWLSQVGDGYGAPRFVDWHRRTGWLAVAGLLLVGVVLPRANLFPASAGTGLYLVHAIPCVVCAAAVLTRGWVIQRRQRRGRRQVALWLIALNVLGACFFALTWALWADRWRATPIGGQLAGQQALVLGHLIVGILLILMGRAALRHRSPSKPRVRGRV